MRRAFGGSLLALLVALPGVASADPGPGRSTEARTVADAPASPSSEGEADPTAPAWPDRIGPFDVGTDDGAARLRLSLFAQLQLQIQDREQSDGSRQTDAEIRIRRIRPILRGSFADGRIESVLHIEVAPGAMELIDLFVDGTLHPELRLRAGQFKTPFTQYWQQPLIEAASVDWPLTSRWFGGERQLGVMVHDGRRNPAGLQYALGLFSGENRRGAFARELPAVYGERHGNPSSLTDPRAPEDFHAEIVGRIGHFAADVQPDTIFDRSGGGLRHGVALSASWDTDPVHRRDFALRVAPEVLLKYEGFSLTAIGYLGLVPTLEADFAPGAIGFLTEVGWHAHRHVELAVRYGRVHVFDELNADARAWAAQLEPTDPAQHDAWAAQYGGVGHVRARHELSVAVNVLIIGRSLALMTDASWMRAERDDGERDDLRVRTQLQLAF